MSNDDWSGKGLEGLNELKDLKNSWLTECRKVSVRIKRVVTMNRHSRATYLDLHYLLKSSTMLNTSFTNLVYYVHLPSLLIHWTWGICVPGPHSISLSGTHSSSLTTSHSKQLGSSHGMASTRWGQFPVPSVGSLMILRFLSLKPVTEKQESLQHMMKYGCKHV